MAKPYLNPPEPFRRRATPILLTISPPCVLKKLVAAPFSEFSRSPKRPRFHRHGRRSTNRITSKNCSGPISGPIFLGTPLTAERFQEINGLATDIHETRLLGLYVGADEDGVTIPAQQISAEETQRLVDFAEARLGLASSETFREKVPQEYVDLQAWLLTAFEDLEKRKGILSRGSLDKLAELKDVRAWVRWLKDLFDKAEADGRAAAEWANLMQQPSTRREDQK